MIWVIAIECINYRPYDLGDSYKVHKLSAETRNNVFVGSIRVTHGARSCLDKRHLGYRLYGQLSCGQLSYLRKMRSHIITLT
jgi:hypothetical protein